MDSYSSSHVDLFTKWVLWTPRSSWFVVVTVEDYVPARPLMSAWLQHMKIHFALKNNTSLFVIFDGQNPRERAVDLTDHAGVCTSRSCCTMTSPCSKGSQDRMAHCPMVCSSTESSSLSGMSVDLSEHCP